MKFGLDVSQHQLTFEEILKRTRLAEDAGFDGAWVFDHFTPLYGDPGGPCLEAWTLLAALAARTSLIRLGTLVTGITYRHPSVLTTEIVTVDHVSGGSDGMRTRRRLERERAPIARDSISRRPRSGWNDSKTGSRSSVG